MNKEIRYLAQHLLCAGVSPLSGRDRRVIQRVAHRTYLARSLNQVFVPARNAFDPYPFVFLNLLLSMLAALQAPVIMMSQNRQAEHDRIDAAHDYEVNLQAETEIMALHEKLDELRHQEIVALRD